MISIDINKTIVCEKLLLEAKAESAFVDNKICKTSHRGFTLMEMLIVTSITVILASLAIPTMSEGIRNSKVKELSNEFTTALYLTRSEAIKRGIQVSIKPQVSSGYEWETGWDIFEDLDRNGVKAVNEELIQTYTMPSNDLTLSSFDSTFMTSLAFLPSGASRGSNGAISGGFLICREDNDITKSRTITVQGSGNIIVEIGSTTCP